MEPSTVTTGPSTYLDDKEEDRILRVILARIGSVQDTRLGSCPDGGRGRRGSSSGCRRRREVRGNGRHGCPPRGEGEDVAPGGRRGLHGRANMMMDLISISTDVRAPLTGQLRAGVSGQHQAPGPAVLASVTIACMCSVAISLLPRTVLYSQILLSSSSVRRHRAASRQAADSLLLESHGTTRDPAKSGWSTHRPAACAPCRTSKRQLQARHGVTQRPRLAAGFPYAVVDRF